MFWLNVIEIHIMRLQAYIIRRPELCVKYIINHNLDLGCISSLICVFTFYLG